MFLGRLCLTFVIPAWPGVATLAKSVRLDFETRIENLSDFSAGG